MHTLNFLPPELKARRRLELALLLLQELLLALVAVAVIATGILAVNKKMLAQVATAENGFFKTNEAEVVEKIATIRKEINDLQKLQNREHWLAPLIADLLIRIPAPIKLRTIEFDEPSMSVTFMGTAATRDSLLEFESVLRATPRFTNVRAPLGAIAQRTNVAFSISADLVELTPERR